VSDVRDNIKIGKYTNHISWVVTPTPVNDDMSLRQVREHKEADKQRAKEQREKYWEESSRLESLFKEDLEAENGLVGHPKADKVYSMAYEAGHSSGYEQVVYEYERLVELLKD